MKVAVIGAGMAGLTCARELNTANYDVTLFDKSKGTGGRMASRSASGGWIDHGAPYFSSEAPLFTQFLQEHVETAALQQWDPTIQGVLRPDEQAHWIGVPRNSAVTRSLLAQLEFQPSTRIAQLQKTEYGWELYNDGASLLGVWDRVIIAVPAPQALLLTQQIPGLYNQVNQVKMEPCWVTAIQTQSDIPKLAHVTIDPHPAIRRITHNSTKTGRIIPHVYTIQATKEWTKKNLEESPDNVGVMLSEAFKQCTSTTAEHTTLLTHRWRYAFTEVALGKECLVNEDGTLGLCGDWCLGRRVEDAWKSGLSLARLVIEHDA